MNQLVVQEKTFESSLLELENIQKMTNKLLQMKHYQKMGDVGIFAVIQKAKSIGLDPLDALNGGCYFVNGKVELSANTMNYLIRQAGHSITKDERSTKDMCILKGKRCDNGDTFTCSFSIDDAKKAGIYKNVWQTYPEDMLFARALTRLARQLFPDVCKGCYIEGELPRDMEKAEFEEIKEVPKFELSKPVECITAEQAIELSSLISDCDPEKQPNIWEFLKKKCADGNLATLKKECYPKLHEIISQRRDEYQARLLEMKMDGELEIDGQEE